MAYDSLAEVIDDYGPALASDPTFGAVVTLNGAYFNLWIEAGGEWSNTEAFDAVSRLHEDQAGIDPFDTLAEVGLKEAMEEAEAVLEAALKEAQSRGE